MSGDGNVANDEDRNRGEKGVNGARKLFTLGRHVHERRDTSSVREQRTMSDSITLYCLATNVFRELYLSSRSISLHRERPGTKLAASTDSRRWVVVLINR